MSFFVTFWGVRGSIPTPGPTTSIHGGNTACVEVRSDDALFICDGGSGLRELGIDLLGRNKGPIEAHFLFSHMHWDHIQGFPFFAPIYIPSNTFHIYGTSAGDTRYHRLLSGQMSSAYFPVDYSDLGGNIVAADLGEGSREIQGVRVSCMKQNHPGGCWAYSFEKEGRKVVYATDSELDELLPNAADIKDDPRPLRALPADMVEFCRGAQLLIIDAQYTDEEYLSKIGWGHPRASTAVDLAVLAEVEEVALFHHDPMHSDDEIQRIVSSCRARAERHGSEVFVFAAREGFEMRID